MEFVIDAGHPVPEPLDISSPTQGTDRYALRKTGTAKLLFGGNTRMSLATTQLLHAYAGEVRSRKVSVGGVAVVTQGGINVAGDVAMLTVQSNPDSDVVAHLKGRGTQAGELLRMGRDAAVGTRFDMRGRFIQAKTVAPMDADLANGELSIYVDATSGAMKLMIKARDAGGTLRTGSVALT
ncbi:hypothetical protein [Nocardioides pacificus]